MTMLLFDAGNSRCKWAWIENGRWLQQGVLDNMDDAAWQQLRLTLAALEAPQKILVSNVAGAALEHRLGELCKAWPCSMRLIVAQAVQCGVRNSYAHPAQLGSDRWAALIAAWHRVQGACLVVNCGTATTVDALSATGEFLGGLILPGMELMRRSLLHNTAQLGLAQGELRDFPRTTADAIASGVIRASIGAIQHQYALLAAHNGARCMVSGGAAASLLPHLGLAAEQVDNLVLQGMQIIGQECSTMTDKETVAR
ncbi:MAG TPA: type III pantothenate kinase [Gallionellaceae bacterium]|nr:type III pantothenate kinase [Gallionellaceae bacterium]